MKVTLFGASQATPADPEAAAQYNARTQLMIAWLGGDDVPLDADLVAMLRAEFLAQDAYRQALIRKFGAHCDVLDGLASRQQGALELPADPAQQFDAGYRAGQYVATTTAAQAARRALTEATAEVAG